MFVERQFGAKQSTDVLDVGPGFFTTMQIPILLGREMDERDASGARHVVINDSLYQAVEEAAAIVESHRSAGSASR